VLDHPENRLFLQVNQVGGAMGLARGGAVDYRGREQACAGTLAQFQVFLTCRPILRGRL
jgi:hypothetical protein